MTNTPWTSSFCFLAVAASGVLAGPPLPLLFCWASRSALSRTVSAWIGMVRALLLVPVVILPVAERPGRRFVGGSFSVTVNLKFLASWVVELICDVEG